MSGEFEFVEFGRAETPLSDADVVNARRLIVAMYAALAPLSAEAVVSVLQSITLTALKDFNDPIAAWEMMRAEITAKFPMVVHAGCAGDA